MKKNYLLGMFAMAAFAFVGCSQDEMVNESPDVNKAIEFGTYVGRDAQGRGVVLEDTNLLNFGVFASYTGQNTWVLADGFNFMFNQKVERENNNSLWNYNPKKYWPTTKNDKISFWAYAPYVSTNSISIVSTNESTSFPQIKYTLTNENLPDAEDFTADVLMDEIKEGNNFSIDSNDREIAFNLKHELSRINFQAKLDREGYSAGDNANKTFVNIKNIEFGGVAFATEGVYNFSINEGQRGNWIFSKVNQTLNIDELLNKTDEKRGEYEEKGIRIDNTILVSLFKNNQYLFHIPTNGTTGTGYEGDVTITITYDIVTVDGSLNAGHSVTPAVKKFNLPEGSLKQGIAYNYILTFGLNEIKLSASVANWVDDTVYDDVDWTITDVLQNN